MHIILNQEDQNQPQAYPDWCDLSWFHDCRGITGDVELHYHDAPEIWLWHEGTAEGLVDGRKISLYPGVMVYTPAGCLHAYQSHGQHSNTGITPRRKSWMRPGHLHLEETGENPSPKIPAFHFQPAINHPDNPSLFPPEAFLKTAYRGLYEADTLVLQTITTSWMAILVREGCVVVTFDEETVTVNEPELLIVDQSCFVQLRTKAACELSFAVGRPVEKKENSK